MTGKKCGARPDAGSRRSEVRANVKTALKKTAKIAGITSLVAPLAATAGIVTVDHQRKRRTPPSGEFPHLPPKTTIVDGEKVTLYTYGLDLYEDMLADIDRARHSVFFETFIIHDDAVGERFRRAFIEAAKRGVEVYIIVDTWGTLNQPACVRRFPEMDHLHALAFPLVRTGILTGRSRDKGRDHRKILTVDDTIGYVGGYNIAVEHATQWRDTHIRIEGPTAFELADTFADQWNSYRKTDDPRILLHHAMRWGGAMHAVLNSPASNQYPIGALYLDALNRASERAWITMGYFVPDTATISAMIAAAERGVDVRLLIPQYSNHIYSDWVGRVHYERLLEAGVHIFLFKDAMIHSKTMTMDSKWSTVGTANIDRISFRGNFEVNMSILDEGFARLMEEMFENDLTNAFELTLEEWQKRGPVVRVTEKIMHPLTPLM